MTDTTEARLAALERSSNLWRLSALGLCALLILLLAGGSGKSNPGTVRASAFELVELTGSVIGSWKPEAMGTYFRMTATGDSGEVATATLWVLPPNWAGSAGSTASLHLTSPEGENATFSAQAGRGTRLSLSSRFGPRASLTSGSDFEGSYGTLDLFSDGDGPRTKLPSSRRD